MLLPWLTQLGDWNPQLLRELKSRLMPQNIVATGMASLLVQFVTVMWFRQRLALPLNAYSISRQAGLAIAWKVWWLDLLNILTLEGLVLFVMLGSYLLTSDLAKEEQLGTLTFLRLSPQSGQTILLGKLLGVPILLYLAIALAMPLHLWATVQAGLPWFLTFCLYLWLATACGLVFSIALWCPLRQGSGARSWQIIIPAGILYVLFFVVLENGWSASRNVFNGIGSINYNDSVMALCVGYFTWAVIMSAIVSMVIWAIWQGCLERFSRPPS